MAAIINADDGVISGASGLKLSSDTSGALNIQTNGVTAIAISASQAVSFPATTSLNFTSANITTLTSSSATITNLLATTLTVSSVGIFPAGSASSAAITTAGDTNTGIFFPAADTIAFTEGGVEAARFNSSGDFGVGETSPDSRLEVAKAITFANIDTFPQLCIKPATGSTGNRLNLAVDNSSNIAFIQSVNRGVGDIPLVLQRYAGNVGIGTSSPGQKLEVAGNIFVNTSGNPYMEVKTSGAGNNPYLRLTADTNNWTIQGTFSNANDELFFMNNSNTRMAITAGGDVGIGTTSPATKLDVRGIVYTDNQYRVGTNSAGANTGIIKWNAGNSLGIYTWSDALDIQIGGSNVLFKTEAGTERARVTSDGNFLVGMTARPIAISNAIGYKNAANGVSSGTGMNGSTWVDLVTLPTPSIAGARINILGNENSNINTYFGMWVIAYNSSGWGITGPFNENQRGNDYGVPNLRISGGKIQVQARNGVSNGLIYYNIEYFSV